MLEELEIRNLGPIRHAILAPSQGMTAITGETGAGKSMLLSAIRLISGESAQSGRVSTGADEAWAQGVFRVDEEALPLQSAIEAGVHVEDGELFLSRTVPASGRSRAVLNGHSVPRAVLQDIASQVVVIHGQADQLRIASASRQREFLDMVADNAEITAQYAQVWNELRDLDQRLERLSNQEASMRQQADYLRESIERINRVDPHAGEDDELKAKRSRIENAAEITLGTNKALAALDASQVEAESDEPGASQLIAQAIQALQSIHSTGPYDEAVSRLRQMNDELADVVFSLSEQDDIDGDINDLDGINSRIHELGELTRRWGPSLDDVLQWRDRAQFEVEDLDDSPQKLAELSEQREKAFETAVQVAGKLSESRRYAAARLSAAVTKELDSLAMAGSRLDIEVAQRTGENALDANGIDDVQFLFTPYPGAGRLPMGKSASGGELSRLMLALELSAADSHVDHQDMTFIFDEVDAGVGGKAAVELGKRLARLAQSAQVIVVTHLAQVASWAGSQFVVSKGQEDGDSPVSTTVNQVVGDARVMEIARMLSGAESETSLEHAKELLGSSIVKQSS